MDENKNFNGQNEEVEEAAEKIEEAAETLAADAEEIAEAAEEVVEAAEGADETAENAEEVTMYSAETPETAEEVTLYSTETPAEIKKGSKIGVVIAIVAAVVVIAAAIVTQTIETNKYNKLGYVDISGRTVQDIVDAQGMKLEDFLKEYGLPEDMPGDTIEAAAYYCMPVSKIAEMYGMDFAQLKEVLKFPDEITENSTWGEAEGSVKLSDYLGTEDISQFKSQYGLGDEVTAETQWKDVRNVVDEKQRESRIAAEKQQEEASKNADKADDTAKDESEAADSANTDDTANAE